MIKLYIYLILISSHTLAMDSDTRKKIETENAIKFVQLGYGDILNDQPFRSLNFKTECLESVQIMPVIGQIKRYNSFSGEKIQRAIEAYKGRVTCYEFGRADSPILIIQLPYWTHQREGMDSSKKGIQISDKENKKLESELRKTFVEELAADSFEKDKVNNRMLKIWWD